MDLIKISIKRPTAVIAIGLIFVVFGFVAVKNIPIQMAPDVDRPILQITSWWPGTSPLEVEREVSNRIEEELIGVPGVTEVRGRSQLGRSRTYLEFDINADMEKAFMVTSSRLSNISAELPEEAGEATIRTTDSEDRPFSRLAITRLPGNNRNIETYGDFVETVVIDRLERVRGVSQISSQGGSPRELQVIVEPKQLAQFQLTVPNVLNALRQANISSTAGTVEEGKRRYIVRTDSEVANVDRIKGIVLKSIHDPATNNIRRVKVDDVAKVQFGYEKPATRRRFLGKPMIRLNALRNPGANVIDVNTRLEKTLKELNDGPLAKRKLEIVKYYDETVYINAAIDLVHKNIFIGGVLAALILLLFLRSFGSTLVVSFAIPLSIVGAFVAMAALGRSINLISLAGIAFAIGMVVDAAIVVLENIYRFHQQGKSRVVAAYQGAKQVWGAILASALTTVVVFIPLLMLEIQTGQLFRDLAVAISVGVLISLLVAITVIPSLTAKLVGKPGQKSISRLRIPIIDDLAEGFVRVVLKVLKAIISRKAAAFSTVVLLCSTTGLATYYFLPPLDYLPDGNRNFVVGRLKPPPGYNLKTMNEIAEQIENDIRPLWASETGPISKPGEPPKIGAYFFISQRDQIILGASSVDLTRSAELEPIMNKAILKEPGMKGWANQVTIFGRRIGGSRTINLNFTGPEYESLLGFARRADELIRDEFGRRQVRTRARPGLHMMAPEIRIVPDYVNLANAGLTARDFAQTIDALNDGVKAAEINVGSRRMNLKLMGPRYQIKETQGISNLPIALPSGTIVPASSLSKIEVISGPQEIRHYNLKRAVRLQIRPDKKLPLETAINRIKENVIKVIKKEGVPEDIDITMSGASDKLTETWDGLKFNLVVAAIIVYLVMAILFESFLYPAIIMLSVPLATFGGIGGLTVLNLYRYQSLDMLTMMGFVILIGIVVNNAILLVHRTLQHVRNDGMEQQEAIMSATHNRMRPIFMSTLTTIFGLMPLVVFGGAGSEIYRGLGSVVIGGLSLSAILTLLIIPCLLSLFIRKAEIGKSTELEPQPTAGE